MGFGTTVQDGEMTGDLEVGTNEQIQRDEDYMPLLPFFAAPYPAHHGLWEPSGIYIRNVVDPTALGDSTSPPPDIGGPRCFNCSSTTHILSACPHTVDKPLVALSRQIYDFEHAGEDEGAPRSLREVAERIERAEWAGRGGDGFVPGKVGGALRRALRSRGGPEDSSDGESTGEEEDDDDDYEWLANMALWGYPPGWVSVVNPRERMLARILHERDPLAAYDDQEAEAEEVMKIWGEDGEEDVVISGSGQGIEAETNADDGSEEEHTTHSPLEPLKPRRWARYPSTHFAWDKLTVYNGVLLSQRHHDFAPQPALPPPPEPAGLPPPLPPPPLTHWPPPAYAPPLAAESARVQISPPTHWQQAVDDGEAEMDFSD